MQSKVNAFSISKKKDNAPRRQLCKVSKKVNALHRKLVTLFYLETVDTGGAGSPRDLTDEIVVEMPQENWTAQDES
jgi:hypothetical protein